MKNGECECEWRFHLSGCRSIVSTFFSLSASSEVLLHPFPCFSILPLHVFTHKVLSFYRYAVLGAGFAGLSVTWHLLKVRFCGLCFSTFCFCCIQCFLLQTLCFLVVELWFLCINWQYEFVPINLLHFYVFGECLL